MPAFGSFCSGIGGLDLGLERAGWTCTWQCEIDQYCRSILANHWPDVPCYDDIRTIPNDAPRVDLLAGGFPCQPVSLAGLGRAQLDERWLWPAVARLVRVLRPRLVLLENVPGLLVRGFSDVLGDLAAVGFDAEWFVLGAWQVGAPHRRDRVFVVAWDRAAYPDGVAGAVLAGRDGAAHHVADAEGARREGWKRSELPAGRRDEPPGRGEALADTDGDGCPRWTERDRPATDDPTGPNEPQRHHPQRRRPDGAERVGHPEAVGERAWAVEPAVGRVADGVPGRVAQLRALGNAVVPQVAELVGGVLMGLAGDTP